MAAKSKVEKELSRDKTFSDSDEGMPQMLLKM